MVPNAGGGFFYQVVYWAWYTHRHYWLRVMGIGRWVLCISLYVYLVFCLLVIYWPMCWLLSFCWGSECPVSILRDTKPLWDMGFGTAGIRALEILIPDSQAPNKGFQAPANTITSNLVTSGRMWRVLRHSKTRVTPLTGDQRLADFVSVPHRYSVPLMIAPCLVRWLVSQNMFLARILEHRALNAAVGSATRR